MISPDLSCRDLEAVGDDDHCGECHADQDLGLHRLKVVELQDGREAIVCHTAEKVLRERGQPGENEADGGGR